MYHHMVDLREEHGAEAMESTAIFMIGYGPDNSLQNRAGNFISVDYKKDWEQNLNTSINYHREWSGIF